MEFRVACHKESGLSEKKDERDFYAIGVCGTFLGQMSDDYPSELSLAETLQTIVPEGWPSPAVRLITDFVNPWIERFRIYD
jgi:hypothetical protein